MVKALEIGDAEDLFAFVTAWVHGDWESALDCLPTHPTSKDT